MVMNAGINAEKKSLRRELLSVLRSIPDAERLISDAAIRRQIENLSRYKQAGRLFVFIGVDWEVDTRPLIAEALAEGKRVAVPRCLPGGVMQACLICGLGDLQKVPPLGLWEPAEGAPVLPPDEIDLALIPCIACDRSGRRLGQGGGYYDRFLKDGAFLKAALCREALLQEALPAEEHDIIMDVVITERQSIWRI